MPTAAQRIERLEDRVKYLEEREKLTEQAMSHLREQRKSATAEADRQRDEAAKLREEFARFREIVIADAGKQSAQVAVHQAEIAELKKHREHWSQRVWQIAAGLLLAAAGGVIGYLLKK